MERLTSAHTAGRIISQGLNTTADVTPNHIRLFLIHLADQSMNDGGRHNIYGAIRTFFY
jgi:hypothetical protein